MGTFALVCVIAVGLLMLTLIVFRGVPETANEPPRHAATPRRTGGAEQSVDRLARARAVWAEELHEAVTRPCNSVPAQLDVGMAHFLIRRHRDCSSDRCACRLAALEVLRLNGHYVPAPRGPERRR